MREVTSAKGWPAGAGGGTGFPGMTPESSSHREGAKRSRERKTPTLQLQTCDQDRTSTTKVDGDIRRRRIAKPTLELRCVGGKVVQARVLDLSKRVIE
jgi:hypothetical protein